MSTILTGELSALYGQRAMEFFAFRYGFVLDALGAAIVVGVLCAVVGTFMVLRGYSLLGDAVGHATLPGVCGAFLMVGAKSMGALLVGALVSGALGAFAVGVLSRGPRTRPDAAVGIVLSVFFGLGIVLLSYIQASPTGAQAGLSTFLFGNAAGVSREQLFGLVAIASLMISMVIVFYRPLMLAVFDEGYARSLGMRTDLVIAGLLAALAICVVISIQAVGVILVAAMLIIPPSTALFLSSRLPRVLGWSAVLGALSGALGVFFSFLFEGVATGPAMVLVATVWFLLALVFGPRGGLVRDVWRRRCSPS
jgi:manganese transport system permease protein